jgi:hypothetical protein
MNCAKGEPQVSIQKKLNNGLTHRLGKKPFLRQHPWKGPVKTGPRWEKDDGFFHFNPLHPVYRQVWKRLK